MDATHEMKEKPKRGVEQPADRKGLGAISGKRGRILRTGKEAGNLTVTVW
jgi:hypothetical protein